MNTTTVLRHIKRKIGASHFPVPVDDDEIIEIIEQETLPTFSTYFPYFYNMKVNPKTQSTGEPGCYFIEDNDMDIEVIGIAQVYRDTSTQYDYLESEKYNVSRYTNDFFGSQVLADFTSAVEVPQTFNFHPPNVLEVFPKNSLYNTPFFVKVKAIHPSHLGTISMSLRDEFLKLALYDVQISMYHILKFYEGMGTGVGNIALKTEEFEAADANRKELLETWSTKYLKESNRKKIWIS